MTTGNKTEGKLSSYVDVVWYGQGVSVTSGSVTKRAWSGQDRAPGTFPGMIRDLVYYWTKPHIQGGHVIRERELHKKYVWRRDPNPVLEVEHNYDVVFDSRSNTKQYCNGMLPGYYSPENWNIHNIPIEGSYAIADPWSSNDQISLLGKLREHVAGSSFNAGVALAESGEAIEMIANTTRKVFEAYKSVKRGDPFKAAKILGFSDSSRSVSVTKKLTTNPESFGSKVFRAQNGLKNVYGAPVRTPRLISGKKAAANNWLELQYGWKPLLSDIYEGMVYVDHQIRHPTVHTVRVTKFHNGNMNGVSILYQPNGRRGKLKFNVKSSRKIVARLTAIDHPRLVGLMDPAPVLWEILPFSFVVDWFIPIGNFLSALSLVQALTGTFITTSRVKIKLMDTRLQNLPLACSPMGTHDGRNSRMDCTLVSRRVSTALNLPLPEIKPISQVASIGHLANAVALFVGIRKDR